jgi:DNA-binding transcriptional MerR regulator
MDEQTTSKILKMIGQTCIAGAKLSLFSRIIQSFTVSMIKTEELTKLYYTIGEVSDMFRVNPSLIRFWEKEFPVIQPKKNKKGNRLFTPKDIENFNKIYYLVKEKGYTLDGARKALKEKISQTPEASVVKETPEKETVIEKLEHIKNKLLSLKS